MLGYRLDSYGPCLHKTYILARKTEKDTHMNTVPSAFKKLITLTKQKVIGIQIICWRPL